MQNELKQQVAKSALAYVPKDEIIGVGTGSTVDYFIRELATMRHDIAGAVASSERSKKLLEEVGIEVLDINSAPNIAVYIDGADEVERSGYCIKGGGGALTREKIVAAIANKFICIVDDSKVVDVLGRDFPVAIEVLAEARSHVGRDCVAMGANPVYREGFVTDSGHIILDVYGLNFSDIKALDSNLNAIVGVVCHGLFVAERPDTILVASSAGVTAFAAT